MGNKLKTSYYLVDYENTRQKGIEDLSNLHEGDNLIVFYSDICGIIPLSLVEILNKIGVKFNAIKVKVGTKNALDFQLASYLGYLIKEFGSNAQYYIVSNDKGYECLCDFWSKQNIDIKMIDVENKSINNDLITIEEIRKILDKDENPEEVLRIFNENDKRITINSKLVALYKQGDKAGKVYRKLKTLFNKYNKN